MVFTIALIGALGVGSQWLAWRLRMPGIVLMLSAGVLAGPVLGVLHPEEALGAIVEPLVAIAVAIILFEGGLTLNFKSLRDAAVGVRRLVLIGAPLGWLLSALALHYVAGLGWESSAVFGGIMIVTGPTVIAPLLRQARLPHRPAALLQWEAIINDPIGAMVAVLAFEVVAVRHHSASLSSSAIEFLLGIVLSVVIGAAAGKGIVEAFRRGWAPEFMKVPILFVVLLAAFASADMILHESGLLAVTIMGIVIANADLASYGELRRFKEHATVLLVSGVFILLAASIDVAAISQLNWRSGLLVVVVILVVRPLTVLISLASTAIPMRERWLIALTGPRGVVLMAVAALFGERLTRIGVPDGAMVGPLAFLLVAATVVLHGFTLTPVARFLGVVRTEVPGILLVGGSRWSVAFAEALREIKVPVQIADRNHLRLRRARAAKIDTFYGDVLSEAAEQHVELTDFGIIIVATDNDAYNTLVATDLAPEFGRANIYQVTGAKDDNPRHALPSTLGGQKFGSAATFEALEQRMAEGWSMQVTALTKEFDFAAWREASPEAILLVRRSATEVTIVVDDPEVRAQAGMQLVAMVPKKAKPTERNGA